jgi:hypothetical protein
VGREGVLRPKRGVAVVRALRARRRREARIVLVVRL